MLSFIQLYMAPPGYYGSGYIFKDDSLIRERKQVDFYEGSSLLISGCSFNLSILVDDFPTYTDDWKNSDLAIDNLFSSAIGSPHMFKHISVHVPTLTIRDGKLGIWDQSFYLDAPNTPYEEYIEHYLDLHPNTRIAFEQEMSSRKEDIEAQKNRDAEFRQYCKETDEIEQELSVLDDRIKTNDQQITQLRGKIFGKAKAQAQIDQLNSANITLSQQREKLNQKLNELKTAFEKTKDYQRPTSDFTYIQRLLEKYDYFIEWQWIDEQTQLPKEEKEEKTIESKPVQIVSPPATGSTASEIREYKMLLDDGIITKEEFEAKKKQLLGL